jgi:uncharacterized protein (TIGR02246 family)
MDTDATRQLIQRFLRARADNDYDAIFELLADDAQWSPPASSSLGPYTGREEVAKALAGGAAGAILDVSTIKRDVRKVVVDGDTAVVQQTTSAKTVKGLDYVNEYCWIYTFENGRIRVLDEYADTLLAARIFGWVAE